MRNQRNFLETPLHDDCIHEGEGLCHHATILPADAFEAPIRFVNYTILPKGASFGLHTHGDDNELYILLSGSGHYTCNGETVPCKAGDILVNPAFGTHGLCNDGVGGEEMRVLVIEAYNAK